MATANTNQGEWYTSICHGDEFILPVRYQNLVPIRRTSFDTMIRATDTKTNRDVAIEKKIRPLRSQSFAERIYQELKLLMYLNHPDAQFIQLLNVFTPEKTLSDFQTLYFVFNFVEYDLNRVIRRNVTYTNDEIKLIIYSLLRGLKFIHSADVVHRNLQPSKIGLNRNGDLTILDCGLLHRRPDETYYYPQARWWRAPEVYINENQYRGKFDIWSVGCIMAEMILLRPIFPGSDHIDQLNKIFDILGTPDSSTLNETCPLDASDYISKLSVKPKQNFSALFGFKYNAASETPISGVSPEGVDLLDRLLSFDPRVRPTTEEALAHPFFTEYHEPMDEPTVAPMVDEYEGEKYTVEEWKAIIWEMIEEFEPPSWITDNVADQS